MLEKISRKIWKVIGSLIGPERRYRELFEYSVDGMYISTLEGRYLEVNHALVFMLGYSSKKELLEADTRDLYCTPEDRPSHEEKNRTYTACLKKKDGSEILVETCSKVLYWGGRPMYYEGIVRDRDGHEDLGEKLSYPPLHDPLTGLYNRAYFDEELKRLKDTRKLPVTIMAADIDRMKYINDSFGLETGDRLLRRAACIFRGSFRSEDLIARTGGDEFCIILPGTCREEAMLIIQRIKASCEFESSPDLPISISFGAAEKKNTGEHLKNVLQRAERAMYSHKRKTDEALNR